MVEIHVFKVPELSKHYQVSDAGLINFPLLGTVAAAGKTTGELEQHLASQLGTRFLQSPQVNVTLKEYNSQRITLEGAGIRKPGVYPLTGPTTLLQLIAMSGGLSETSDSQLAIHRQAGGRPEVLQFDIDSLRSGRTRDPLLSAGDVVFASSSTTKEVFNGLIRAAPLASAVLRPY